MSAEYVQQEPGAKPEKKGFNWGLGCGIGCLVLVVLAIILAVVVYIFFDKIAEYAGGFIDGIVVTQEFIVEVQEGDIEGASAYLSFEDPQTETVLTDMVAIFSELGEEEAVLSDFDSVTNDEISYATITYDVPTGGANAQLTLQVDRSTEPARISYLNWYHTGLDTGAVQLGTDLALALPSE